MDTLNIILSYIPFSLGVFESLISLPFVLQVMLMIDLPILAFIVIIFPADYLIWAIQNRLYLSLDNIRELVLMILSVMGIVLSLIICITFWIYVFGNYEKENTIAVFKNITLVPAVLVALFGILLWILGGFLKKNVIDVDTGSHFSIYNWLPFISVFSGFNFLFFGLFHTIFILKG